MNASEEVSASRSMMWNDVIIREGSERSSRAAGAAKHLTQQFTGDNPLHAVQGGAENQSLSSGQEDQWVPLVRKLHLKWLYFLDLTILITVPSNRPIHASVRISTLKRDAGTPQNHGNCSERNILILSKGICQHFSPNRIHLHVSSAQYEQGLQCTMGSHNMATYLKNFILFTVGSLTLLSTNFTTSFCVSWLKPWTRISFSCVRCKCSRNTGNVYVTVSLYP
jgi:hypothetical protein